MIVVAVLVVALPFQAAYAAPTTIQYDSGITANSCSLSFCGVMFSLPSGVTSARLLTVQYAWSTSGGGATINVHITGSDHVTELSGSPVATTSTVTYPPFNSLDVSGLGIVVAGNFWVVMEKTGTGWLWGDNSLSGTHSFFGLSLAGLTSGVQYNMLLRVVIDPLTYTAVPGVPVGGEMLPINKVQVMLPWLALISALSIIPIEMLIRRRRTDGSD